MRKIIITPAIRLLNKEQSVVAGETHNKIIKNLLPIVPDVGDILNGERGFLTSGGFIGMEEAYEVARESGQLNEPCCSDLSSGDLL